MTSHRFRELLPLKPIFDLNMSLVFIRMTCKRFEITEEDIFSKVRTRENADARAVVQRWQYHSLEWSYPEIAKFWNYKDHTGVRHNVLRAENLKIEKQNTVEV